MPHLAAAASRAHGRQTEERSRRVEKNADADRERLRLQATHKSNAYAAIMDVLRTLVPGWAPFPGRFDWEFVGSEGKELQAVVVLEGRLRFGFHYRPYGERGNKLDGFVEPVSGSHDSQRLKTYGNFHDSEWLDALILKWDLS